MDLFPTALELAGVPLPSDREYDGRSMVPLLTKDEASAHDILFFYGGAAGQKTPSAARYGPFKAHWATGPGLSGCVPGPGAPVGCKKEYYPKVPLLFNVEVDPSEAYALTHQGMPLDPKINEVVVTLQAAYEKEVKSLVSHTTPPAPDGPGEGPGAYGVCCDRSRGCDCDGKPSGY
jgi:arylsulfatase A-like enzyme